MNLEHYNNIDFGNDGIIRGLYYGQNERVDEINARFQERQFPNVGLPPNYDPRPASTKFTLFPIVDMRKQTMYSSVPFERDQTNTRYVYNTGTQNGPPMTKIALVDTETDLYGQSRKRIDQIYIPCKQSDFYKVLITPPSKTCAATINGEEPHPNLFKKETYKNDLPEYLAKKTYWKQTNAFNNCSHPKCLYRSYPQESVL